MYIYLDQNKWIDFARAVLDKPKGAEFKEVSNKIISKVESGEWVLPISIVHIMETINIKDEVRKEEFSKILFDYSKANTICSYNKISKYEFVNAWLEIFGESIDVKDILFEQNICNLLDIDNDDYDKPMYKLINNIINSQDVLFNLTNSSIFDTIVSTERTEWESFAATTEIARNNLIANVKDDSKRFKYIIVDEYKRLETASNEAMTLEARKRGLLNDACIKRAHDYIQNNFEEWLQKLPSLFVRANLCLQRYKNTSKPFDRNDVKDMAFLSTAIPYCDIVITEKSWTSHTKSSGLDKMYGTKILSNLNDLLNI